MPRKLKTATWLSRQLGRSHFFAQAEGSGAGQFFTPGSVVLLLVEMIEPLCGCIMDLACGSGGMFVQAHGGDRNDISL